MKDAERLEEAVISLEGRALIWYQWEHQRRAITRWEELKGLVLRQFRAVDQGSLEEQWAAVVQTGTVEDYCLEFVEKATYMEPIPESMYLGVFINGLEEEVKRELRIHGPTTIEMAMDFAIKIDQKINVGHRDLRDTFNEGVGRRRHVSHSLTPQSHSFKYPANNPQIPPQKTHYSNPKNSSYQNPHQTSQMNSNPRLIRNPKPKFNITHQEMMEKRARGLCFTCDEKWSHNHVCKKQEGVKCYVCGRWRGRRGSGI